MVATHKVSAAQRKQMVSEAAYFLAEHRGFNGGDPVADWLQAEAEVDTQLGETQRLIEQLEERLEAVNRKLKTARKKLASMTADVREEWQRDTESLAKLRDGFQERLVELRKQGADASEKTRQQLEKAWNEASELLHRLDRRVKKQGDG
jgi:oligoendopeptidase F